MPPTISLVEPRANSIVRGTQRLIALAEDDVELEAVMFIAEGKHLQTDSTTPYSVQWDTTASPDGILAVTAVGYDLAGNAATAKVSVIVRNRQDRTPPRVTVATRTREIKPGGHRLVPVTFTGTATDDVSPINAVSFRMYDEYDRVQPSGLAPVTRGRFSITVLLEATRRGQDFDGRRYKLNVGARDAEGNETFATASLIVKHDNR